MKIGLIADTHIGRNIPRVVGDLRREAYRHAFSKTIDILVNECVDYVLHAGDLFEKRSMVPSDALFVKREFQRLVNSLKENADKDVKIIVVRGNHDGTLENNTLAYIKHPLAKYLEVLGDEVLRGNTELYDDGKVSIAAVGYHPYIASKFSEVKHVLKESLNKGSSRKFLILHAFIRGYHDLPPGVPEHSILKPQDFDDLDVDTVICGHYHIRKPPREFNKTRFITPGATEAIDLADQGEYGVSILNESYRFVPLSPLHEIRNIKVSSEGAFKPLSWFKEEAEAVMERYIAQLNRSERKGIARLVLKGKSVEPSFRLEMELAMLTTKMREENPSLLHVQIENRVGSTEEAFDRPMGGQDEFLKEAMKPLESGIEEAVTIAEEVEMALEEKASQRTGLLMPSDRQRFTDKWMMLIEERVKR